MWTVEKSAKVRNAGKVDKKVGRNRNFFPV